MNIKPGVIVLSREGILGSDRTQLVAYLLTEKGYVNLMTGYHCDKSWQPSNIQDKLTFPVVYDGYCHDERR